MTSPHLKPITFSKSISVKSSFVVFQSNTNFQHQVVYVQQGTPENPQLIMMQPCAQPMLPVQPNINRMQPIQPYFNGIVPPTAVVMQPGIQSVQNPVEVQPTSTPSQDINNQGIYDFSCLQSS